MDDHKTNLKGELEERKTQLKTMLDNSMKRKDDLEE